MSNDVSVRNLPGMKQSEITKCIKCGQGMMHGNSITFYRITLEYFLVDVGAVRQQHGLEMFFGPQLAGLAQVMGPNEDLAKQVSTCTALMCMDCAIRPSYIGGLAEMIHERHESEKADQVHPVREDQSCPAPGRD